MAGERPMTRWDVEVRASEIVHQLLSGHGVVALDVDAAREAIVNIKQLVEDCAQQASDFGADTVVAILVDGDRT